MVLPDIGFFCIILRVIKERWPSGLRHRFAKPAYQKWYRRFESSSLRHGYNNYELDIDRDPGEVAEWSMAKVLKTFRVKALASSNLALSANL